MSNFEKIGVIFVTGLVAVILAMSFFGTGRHDSASTGETRAEKGPEGTMSPDPERPDTGRVQEKRAGRHGYRDTEAERRNPPVVQGPIHQPTVESASMAPASNATTGSAGDNRAVDSMWDRTRERPPAGAKPEEPGRTTAQAEAKADPKPSAPREIPERSKESRPSPKSRTYKVQKNDSLYAISERLYGSGTHWKKIGEANPGIDPMALHVGIELTIPELGEATLATQAPAVPLDSRAKSDPKEYTVRRGETLYAIAKDQLRDPERWREIYALNRDRLASADRVLAGTVLRIP